MSLAERLQRAWYGEPQALKWLAPLEWLYRYRVKKRRQSFLSGARQAYRAPVPVLVVGNITVGGTGKTPLILWLIEHCRSRGLRVGVVSRGYGAKPPTLPWRVHAGQSAAHAGDEPLLMVERTGVALMLDPDRPRAVRALLAAEPIDIVLSDDGLQHYPLARDLELVLIDARRGLGNGHCLPVGPLREPAQRLQEVDAVLWNGQVDDSAHGYGFTMQPVELVHLATGKIYPLDYFPPGQVVHAVAGIGNPARFFATLEGLNWRPIEHPFADHARYTAQHLQFEPALPVIMTEKDAVKCRAFAAAHWYFLRVRAVPSATFVVWFDDWLARLATRRLSSLGCLSVP